MESKLSEGQRRRVKAGRMLKAGVAVAKVAATVGVARQTVYVWKRVLDESGINGLREMADAGRPCGRSSGWQPLSSAGLTGDIAPCMCGACWAVWAFPARSPSAGRWSGMTLRCNAGRRKICQRLKKSAPGASAHRLYRRSRIERAAHAGKHLGAGGRNTRDSVSLQLETRLGDRRVDSYQLPVPFPRRGHTQPADRGVSQGAQKAPAVQTADHLGWPSSAPQPAGTRLPRLHAGRHTGEHPAALCPGLQSGGVSVGVAQAPCLGQLLSGHVVRVENPSPQQAQERSATTVHHRRLLETG